MGAQQGTVTVNSNDFYGVDTSAVSDYIKQIKAIAITEATESLKKTDKLFQTFRDGWTGHAEENFEKNFDTAVKAIIASLNDGYGALVSEINQVGQGWIDQDAGMVEVK